MSRIRACFLGTPEFAVQCLQTLLQDEHFEIVGVVTQPDRPAGRKMLLTPSPVKLLALQNGLRVISPESVNTESLRQEIAKWGAEVAIVVAFGQILGTKFLDLFPIGAFNIHGSLLPRWRGAAPIQRALEAGDLETGVTLQKVVKELDAGDILGLRKFAIDEKTDARLLYEKLAMLGGQLLQIELMDYIRGNLAPTPQDPALVTYAKKIDKKEALIDWSQSSIKIFNKVRAFDMGPGTYTHFQGKKLKIHKVQVSESDNHSEGFGQVLKIDSQGIFVQCGQGVLRIDEVQPESRAKCSAADFVKGYHLQLGARFGEAVQSSN